MNKENGPAAEKKKPKNKKQDDIPDGGAVIVSDDKRLISCLTIIGEIEGHTELPPQNKTTKYEHVIPQLVTIEESAETAGLLVILNTVGGDIEAGLAIAELIAGMKTPVVSLVLGGGHSIGVPLAVAADYSFIAPSASMTIHPVRSTGLTLGVRQSPQSGCLLIYSRFEISLKANEVLLGKETTLIPLCIASVITTLF